MAASGEPSQLWVTASTITGDYLGSLPSNSLSARQHFNGPGLIPRFGKVQLSMRAEPSLLDSPTNPTPRHASKSRIRLEFLDGIRALAALYVVLHHIYWTAVSGPGVHLPAWAFFLVGWTAYGSSAVGIFIVLSGYCLMLPVVRSADASLPGGSWAYLKRRAQRILPPYYAALALSLLLIALCPGLRHPAGVRWDTALPAFTEDALLSHLFLVQNYSARLSSAIDPPAWTVACEWQIYFLFPFILLPVWRRWNMTAAVAAAFLCGIAPHALFHLHFTQSWYPGMFALGMAGAVVSFSNQPVTCAWRGRISWRLAAVVLAVTAWSFAHFFGTAGPRFVLVDVLTGCAVLSLIIDSTQRLTAGSAQAVRSLALRLFQSRGLVWLGTFSCSLYLVHDPMLALLHLLLRSLPLSAPALLFLMYGLGIPLSVATSYVFYLLIERRFMPGRPRTEAEAGRAAAISPAP